ncbi:hypothetical protein TSUD_136350 [Trifolium subterraneum]|uniref:MADS-box domain-containing protein n=1 Tax=Trifolium subterraneum TaxID=3900 RepID=A0A2Z6NJ95_TRISU|nr:hypothetical protein TSUD_136350 [Trifolium subterraneum]
MLKKKSSLGRQKIPIEKIPKKSHLQVTFSKRRSGLFKKASELCTLCGVEIAIVVFSPANKAFSFGHPEVESIIDRYLSRNPPQESSSNQIVEAHRNSNVRDLNMQLTQLLSHLDIEKKQGEEIDHVRKARQMQFWWESPIDELGFNELLQLKVSIEDLKKNLGKIASKCMMEQSNMSSPNIGANGFGRYDAFENKPGVGINNITSTFPPYYLGFRHGYP